MDPSLGQLEQPVLAAEGQKLLPPERLAVLAFVDQTLRPLRSRLDSLPIGELCDRLVMLAQPITVSFGVPKATT